MVKILDKNYVYAVAEKKDLEKIILMKNDVKKEVERQKLAIWGFGYPLDWMIEEDVEKGEGRVIKEKGEVVAYAALLKSCDEYESGTFKVDNTLSFARLMVRVDRVNRHIGGFFVENMIREAKKRGFAGMGITVDECNEKAVRLYEKYGFKKEGEGQFPYAYLDIYGLYF